MNYTQTDEMRMFLKERKLQRIWMPKATNTMYPMTQIPRGKSKLSQFAWFDYVRPLHKDDIFEWRGKAAGTEMKVQNRHSAPLRTLDNRGNEGTEERGDENSPSNDGDLAPSDLTIPAPSENTLVDP